PEVLERQLEEQILAALSRRQLLADRGIVGGAALDRMIEDGRVGREPRHRELTDVARQRTVIGDPARDVVEPQALPQIVEQCSCFHRVTSSRSYSTSIPMRSTTRSGGGSSRAAAASAYCPCRGRMVVTREPHTRLTA